MRKLGLRISDRFFTIWTTSWSYNFVVNYLYFKFKNQKKIFKKGHSLTEKKENEKRKKGKKKEGGDFLRTRNQRQNNETRVETYFGSAGEKAEE